MKTLENKIELGVYQHFKGNYYEVLYTAKHTETGEDFVVYRRLYNDDGQQIWIRPLSMFCENVNGVPRFRYIGSINRG